VHALPLPSYVHVKLIRSFLSLESNAYFLFFAVRLLHLACTLLNVERSITLDFNVSDKQCPLSAKNNPRTWTAKHEILIHIFVRRMLQLPAIRIVLWSESFHLGVVSGGFGLQLVPLGCWNHSWSSAGYNCLVTCFPLGCSNTCL
jgi:hypothetical protein